MLDSYNKNPPALSCELHIELLCVKVSFTPQLRVQQTLQQNLILIVPILSLPPSQKRSQFSFLSPVTTTTAFCLSDLDFSLFNRSVIQDSGSEGYQEEEFSSGGKKKKTSMPTPTTTMPFMHQNSVNLQPSLLLFFIYLRKYSEYVSANAMTQYFTFLLFKRSGNLAFRKGSNGR